jgi:hypothetical protein
MKSQPYTTTPTHYSIQDIHHQYPTMSYVDLIIVTKLNNKSITTTSFFRQIEQMSRMHNRFIECLCVVATAANVETAIREFIYYK